MARRVSNVLATVAIALCTFSLPACDDYDDTELWNTVNDHESRLEALEQWQAEVNNNIAALQTLLNTNDMITSVTPVTMGDETVGYTISFLHSSPITIYNGTQGEQGEAGETPQIGLTQGDDGNWYWTLNGELMTDADGNPIRANGKDGQDGEDGQDGADGEDGSDGSTGPQGPAGKDAPTPQIKIGSSLKDDATIMTDEGNKIEDAWYLSVDDGKTWYRVSGDAGSSAGCIIKEVDTSNDGYVVFTLADDQEFTVPKYQGITITFTSIDLDQPNNMDNQTLNITYSVNGVTNVQVVAIPSAEGWSATVEDKAITVTASDKVAKCDLLVTATDNKGSSVSYTLRLVYGYKVEGNTYTVSSAGGLLAWAAVAQSNLSTSCTLTANIDLTGKEWTPVGNSGQTYTGTFDGGNHTITGLTMTGSDEYAGLFGYIGSGGTVKNVKLENVQITSDNQYANVGGVAGYSRGNIENCSVSGSVSGNSNSNGTSNCVGGVVGQQYGGTITECTSSAIVDGTNEVGGVVGQTNYGATLTACYATGDVTAERDPQNNTYAGGVVGFNGGGTLTACYATGNVTVTGDGTGSIYVGGVTGDNALGSLTACYHATGDVTGASGSTGGVVGRNFKDSMIGGGIITACYWNGTVTDGNGIGYDMTYAGETTKVTDGNWTEAMKAMNTALSGTSWRYETGSGNEPLMLQKQS